jgi:hypothetical protein
VNVQAVGFIPGDAGNALDRAPEAEVVVARGRGWIDPPVNTPPPASGAADGPLWSDGSVDPHSNDYWAQSNLALKTSGQLTALTVD